MLQFRVLVVARLLRSGVTTWSRFFSEGSRRSHFILIFMCMVTIAITSVGGGRFVSRGVVIRHVAVPSVANTTEIRSTTCTYNKHKARSESGECDFLV